jgi:hypothetical protein
VRRLALAIVVGILTLSASGLSSVLVTEPCSIFELPGTDDGSCPPTCVTCGCCTRAAEPAAMTTDASPKAPAADPAAFLPRLARTDPRDILHVPKPDLG